MNFLTWLQRHQYQLEVLTSIENSAEVNVFQVSLALSPAKPFMAKTPLVVIVASEGTARCVQIFLSDWRESSFTLIITLAADIV